MNKKILFGIFLLSIFLLSTASMVQPVYGYSWGVPKQAIGVTSESEVKIFDDDSFEEHLGAGIDGGDLHGGDADKVGAKSKSTYKEMETDEDLIAFEEDALYEAVEFEDSCNTIRLTLSEIGNATQLLPDSELPPIIELIKLMTYGTLGGADIATGYAVGADMGADAAIPSWATLMGMFADEYDGSILTRDKWDFTDKAYKEKPDVKDDEVPFLADPRDWFAAYKNMEAFGIYLGRTCDAISGQLINWETNLLMNPAKLVAINGTMAAMYPAELKAVLNSIAPGNYPTASFILAYYIINNIYYQVKMALPDKFGYLLQLLVKGMPTYVPQKDFLARMLKEFQAEDDFDGDRLFKIPYLAYGEDISGMLGSPVPDLEVSSLPYGLILQPIAIAPTIAVPMGGETIYIYAYVEVELLDATVKVSIEYEDGQIDPADNAIFGGDNEDELKDFEIEFPYGDTGSQGTISYKDGDETFWQMGGVEQIPGFELTIILGVSAISIIGLIYVIMKKRKM